VVVYGVTLRVAEVPGGAVLVAALGLTPVTAATLRARAGGRQTPPLIGLIAQVVLLAVLAATAGLGAVGWTAGVACAVIVALALAHGIARRRGDGFGPASRVTLARASLAVGVAALAADSFSQATPVALLVTLAAVALALDAVDGRVARRTGTITALGARFDGEVDAFLILALSVYVAPLAGAWVLAIGAARYAFLVAEWLLPFMRTPLPPRRWRRVVAAVQGVVLTVAAAGVLPLRLVQVLLLAALVLLAESFGHDTRWLWRRRRAGRGQAPGRAEQGPWRTAVAGASTGLALLIVWAALVAPNHPRRLALDAFAQLPLELLVVLVLAVLLPAAPRRGMAVIVGAALSMLLLVKVADLGFYTAFDRPADPIHDWGYAGIGIETLRDAVGTWRAGVIVAVVAVAGVALLVLPVVALLRVSRVAAGRRATALSAIAALGAAWVVLRVLGEPVATTSATALVVREVREVGLSLRDHDILERAIARDRFRAVPGDRLLTSLRGKDVLLVFVESYGRVALQGSSFSPGIAAVLERGGAELRAAGFSSRSAFLTSPTFGGISWLAHSTLQSGVWIDRRRRYEQLVRSDRFTLSRAFGRAGWRAVAVMPQNKRAWREGSAFYRFDKVYDRRNVGYRGPSFGLPSMPDQFTLLALQRLELGRRDRPPLFAEVALISSHAPWTHVPAFLPWEDVGDGSIFARLPAEAAGDDQARAYGRSIEYTLHTVVSFVRRYGDDELVAVVVGDHQPATSITGHGASHDVPISIIARDPEVLERIAAWGWADGLRPEPDAPVWRMDAFRDRFLRAFGPAAGTTDAASR
jgi:phosphatidylglycerophosphate synthase